MTEHDVLVVGAGPTGLMLAGELALAGVDVGSSSGGAAASLAGHAPAACTRGRSRSSSSAALLHGARPVLLDLSASEPASIGPWANRVQVANAAYDGAWELPVIGPVPAPSGVLVRPDGSVAWVGERSTQGLADALTAWFGPPAD